MPAMLMTMLQRVRILCRAMWKLVKALLRNTKEWCFPSNSELRVRNITCDFTASLLLQAKPRCLALKAVSSSPLRMGSKNGATKMWWETRRPLTLGRRLLLLGNKLL